MGHLITRDMQNVSMMLKKIHFALQTPLGLTEFSSSQVLFIPVMNSYR